MLSHDQADEILDALKQHLEPVASISDEIRHCFTEAITLVLNGSLIPQSEKVLIQEYLKSTGDIIEGAKETLKTLTISLRQIEGALTPIFIGGRLGSYKESISNYLNRYPEKKISFLRTAQDTMLSYTPETLVLSQNYIESICMFLKAVASNPSIFVDKKSERINLQLKNNMSNTIDFLQIISEFNSTYDEKLKNFCGGSFDNNDLLAFAYAMQVWITTEHSPSEQILQSVATDAKEAVIKNITILFPNDSKLQEKIREKSKPIVFYPKLQSMLEGLNAQGSIELTSQFQPIKIPISNTETLFSVYHAIIHELIHSISNPTAFSKLDVETEMLLEEYATEKLARSITLETYFQHKKLVDTLPLGFREKQATEQELGNLKFFGYNELIAMFDRRNEELKLALTWEYFSLAMLTETSKLEEKLAKGNTTLSQYVSFLGQEKILS